MIVIQPLITMLLFSFLLQHDQILIPETRTQTVSCQESAGWFAAVFVHVCPVLGSFRLHLNFCLESNRWQSLNLWKMWLWFFFFFLFFPLWYPQGLLLSGHFSLITHHHKYVACCRENTAQPLTVQPNKTVCNGCGSARHSGFVNKKMSSIFTNVIWTTFNYYHLLTKLPCSCHREAVKLVVSVVLKMGAQTICSRTVNINFSCFFFLQCATVG